MPKMRVPAASYSCWITRLIPPELTSCTTQLWHSIRFVTLIAQTGNNVELYFYSPPVRRSNAFGRVCGSVCRPVQALTFERIDLETSLLACRYISRISRSFSCIKVIGLRSRSAEQNIVAVSCFGSNVSVV